MDRALLDLLQEKLDALKKHSELKELAEKIESTVDLKRVATDYLTLEDMGDFKKTSCPFHNEDKPSFTISPGNKFYCYGCHRGGTVIDFISSMEKLSRADAVKFINEKYL